MKTKKYYASNPSDALNQVRADLGADAMILQSRRVMRKNWLGFGTTPAYEITAALDSLDDGAPAVGHDKPVQLPASAARLYALNKQLMASGLKTAETTVEQERPLDDESKKNKASLSPQLTALVDRFRSQGLDEHIAQTIVKQLDFELTERDAQDWGVVAEAAARQLERQITTVDTIDGGEDGPVIIFVIGPTGVGKTTTIAKLAAMFTAESEARVSLATSDTFRIGAISQLQAFADILGLPLDVAYSPTELMRSVRRQSAADVILIDTSGYSRNSVTKERLAEYVHAAGRCLVLLAISSTTKQEDALSALEELDGVPVHGLIFTKLDETNGYGSIFNVVNRTGLPAYYMTTGQSVPDDLELASAGRLSARLLGMQA